VEVKFASEAAFTNATVELFTMAGWRVHHDRLKQNVQGHAGFYDIVAVRRGRVVFAELKMPGKYPEKEQQDWLDAALQPLGEAMVAMPIISACWYPEDWDRIVQVATSRSS
jgi:hypothetical protein